MCSLCGTVGRGGHWSDAIARPGVYTRGVTPTARRRERVLRVRIANRILARFGVTLSDWRGAAFLLSTRTGKTEVLDDLGHLWQAAQRLSGKVCDPLDPDLIASFEREDV